MFLQTVQRTLFRSSPITLRSRLLSSLPQTSSLSFEDPSRPGLFYHLLHENSDSPKYAVSFLREAPAVANSPTVIGWLPAAAASSSSASETRPPDEEAQAGLDDFVQNGMPHTLGLCEYESQREHELSFHVRIDSFLEVLHTAIRKALESGSDESINAEASQRASGWLHVNGECSAIQAACLGRLG